MAAKKQKTIGKLKEQASVLAQLLARLLSVDEQGYCKCVSCGAVKHYKEMQGGHFIPRGNSATRLMVTNIHPQCPGCNCFGMKYGDAEKQYTLYMIDRYGREHVDMLLSLKGAVHKWSKPDLIGKIEEFTGLIKVLEAKIG